MTTPTNEAGHGLPELPATRLLHMYGADFIDVYTADQMRQYARDALALSRGVPGVEIVAYLIDGRVEQGLAFDKQAAEDMAFANAGTVVPLARADAISLPAGLPKGWHVERVSGDADLYVLRTPTGLEWIVEPHERLHVLLTAMLAAAPAAAGAQGEDEIDRAARRMGDSARSLLQDIAQQEAPQPAAADGGVRERARELSGLIDRYWNLAYAEGKEGRDHDTDNGDAALCRYEIEKQLRALSSHRQAGEPWTDEQCREFACVAFRHATHNLPKGVTLEDIRMGASVALALVEKGAGNG